MDPGAARQIMDKRISLKIKITEPPFPDDDIHSAEQDLKKC